MREKQEKNECANEKTNVMADSSKPSIRVVIHGSDTKKVLKNRAFFAHENSTEKVITLKKPMMVCGERLSRATPFDSATDIVIFNTRFSFLSV